MNRKARINYIHALSSQVERKKMYKAKKQWVVAGISFLVATGMGAIGSHLTTHADTTNGNSQQTTSVAPKLVSGSASNVSNQKSTNNMEQSSGSAIQNNANWLHANILANANNSAKVSGSSNSAKPAINPSAENVSAQSKVVPHFNSAYENYLKANPSLAKFYYGSSSASISSVNSNSASNKALMKNALLGQNNVGAANIKAHGTWGSTPWTLDNQNNLIFNGGALPTNNYTGGLGHYISKPQNLLNAELTARSIRFENNVIAPQDISGILSTSAHTLDLNYLDVSGLNTSNTKNFYGAFGHIGGLTHIDGLNHLDTHNAIIMDSMFVNDGQLESLDVSSFNTNKVTHFGSMFNTCDSLKHIDGLDHWSIASAVDLNDMFMNDTNLQSLDLSSFNTRPAIANTKTAYSSDGLSGMISGDTNLRQITLGTDTVLTSKALNGKASDSYALNSKYTPFKLADGKNSNSPAHQGVWPLLQHISDNSTWTGAKVILTHNGDLYIMNGYIDGNRNDAKGVNWSDVHHIYTHNVSDTFTYNQFAGLKNLYSADLSGITLKNDNAAQSMFSNDNNLVSIKTPDLTPVINMGWLFNGDSKLQNIDWNNSHPTLGGQYGAISMFQNCKDLQKLDLSNFNIESGVPVDNMLQSDNNLEELNLGNNVQLNPTANLNGNWINVSSNNPKSVTSGDLEDNQVHSGIWSRNAEIIQLQNNGINIYNELVKKPFNNSTTIENMPLFVPMEYKLDDPSQSFTCNGGVTNVSVHLAASDAINSASSLINSDKIKTNYLSSADKNDTSFAGSNVSSISSALSTINADITAINGDRTTENSSNVETEISNANSAYDEAYSANAAINSMVANSASSENAELTKMSAVPVEAFISTPTGNALQGNQLTTMSRSYGTPNPRRVLGVVNLGTYGSFNKSAALSKINSSIPNGYHMNSGKYQLKKTTVNDKPVLALTTQKDANNPYAQSDTFDITGNPVQYTGKIILHFSDGNGNSIQNSILDNKGDITLGYNTGSNNSDVIVGNSVNLLNYLSDTNIKNKNVSSPNNFVNNVINNFNTYGFQYEPSRNPNIKASDYSFTVPVSASNSNSIATNPITNKPITINLTATEATEHINYVYTDANGKQHNEGSDTQNGYIDTTGTVNSNNIKQGWQLTKPKTFTYTYNNGNPSSDKVSVSPLQASATVDYQYKGNTLSNHKFNGNDSQASDASDTSTNITSSNEAGIPTGYQLVNNSTNVLFDNGTHNVVITPIQRTDTINYQYGGNTLSSTTFTGNDSQAKSASDTTFDVTAKNDTNIPAGYHLVNNDNKFSYDSKTHIVQIDPNQVSDVINYQYKDKLVGNHTFTGNDYRATDAGNNSVDVTKTNDPDIPAGYQLVNNDNKFKYDGKPEYVPVIPLSANAKVDYQYTKNNKVVYSDTDTKDFHGNDSRATDASDTSTNITSSNEAGIPTGYQLVSNSTNVPFDNGTHDVAIKPIKITDTVQYVYEDTPINELNNNLKNILGSFTVSGDSSNAQGVNSTFTINTSSPKSKLDPRFKVNNTDELKNSYGNQNHTIQIQVTPENAPLAIYYENQNHKYIDGNGSHTNITSDTPQIIKMSDLPSKNLLTTVGNTIPAKDVPSLLTIPNGYHLGNKVHSVNTQDVKPITLDVPFYDKEAFKVGSMPVLRLMVHLNATYNPATDPANKQIASASSTVNSESQSATSMMSNSNFSGVTRDSISSASNIIASASSAIHSDSGKGASAESNANSALASASSAYSGASSLASSVASSIQSSSASAASASAQSSLVNSVISSYKSSMSASAQNNASLSNSIKAQSEANSEASSKASSESASASATSLANLISNDVTNATKNNKPVAVPTSLTSDEVTELADKLSGEIVVKPQVSATNTTQTVDGSALNNLASEVATNNQEISNLANKPANAESINYDYFNNLINDGVTKLTNAINKDFRANISNVHAQPIKPRRTYNYLKWLRVVKPLKLYTKNGTAKVVRPRHRITLNVKAAYKVNNHIVFKVSYKHHNYFIKANNKAIKNAYLPATKKLVGRRVRILYNVYANRRKTSGRVKTLHKGYEAKIHNIVRIGNHNVTRIQLTDGLWISANLNYVKVL